MRLHHKNHGKIGGRYMEKVCIIGAGSSGIAAAKTFHQADIPFDCFEKGSQIGGLWRYNNDNGLSSAYQSLHINTSLSFSAYSDFAPPSHYPTYPSHQQMIKYFDSYVDHFGFKNKISFKTSVERVNRNSHGQWEVSLSDGSRRHYSSVVVANGHHWDPKTPVFPGKFLGKQMHSHHYKNLEGYKDRNVLILGIGNSAVDIACEVSHIAKNTYVATRRNAYILPKYIRGRTPDWYLPPIEPYVPTIFLEWYYGFLVWSHMGNQDKYGVKRPDYGRLHVHPTMSQDFLYYVKDGRIKMKPNIEKLKGDKVAFVDGSEEPIDTIIYATGYNITFPFLDSSIINTKENQVQLYNLVVSPHHPNLFFVGLVQPLGAIPPLAELQSKWIAGILSGKYELPDQAYMLRQIEKEDIKRRRSFVTSSRHSIEVFYFEYIRQIKSAMREKKSRFSILNLFRKG